MVFAVQIDSYVMSTREEIRSMIRDEVAVQLEGLRTELAANTAAVANSAKALERLTLLTVGDEELKVAGLLSDVDVLKRARQDSMMERTRLAGIWIGASAVGLVVLKALWVLVDRLLATP